MPLRIAFFGTAQLACDSLLALANSAEFQLVAVVTQPDRPKGRHLVVQPSPIKTAALTLQLHVSQPEKARSPAFETELTSLRPDLIVVAAYGQILPKTILELPRFGCLNVHASLLPQYRGAAPIQWAILDDQSHTGVTIMKMDEGLDTGDILTQQSTGISPADDAQSLHDRLAQIGATLLIQTIPEYVAGRIGPRIQPREGATYARKIVKEDGRVDWAQNARAIWNRVRALTPWPGAFTCLTAGTKTVLLKIWQAAVAENRTGPPGEIIELGKDRLVIACGQAGLEVVSLQLEGGKRLRVGEFIIGHDLKLGDRLG